MSNVVSPELIKTIVLLATSVTIVPLFKRIGLGSVLGYLVAGCLIGPSVFGVVKDAESVLHMAELGVVLPIPISPVPRSFTPEAQSSCAIWMPVSMARTQVSRSMAGSRVILRVPRMRLR